MGKDDIQLERQQGVEACHSPKGECLQRAASSTANTYQPCNSSKESCEVVFFATDWQLSWEGDTHSLVRGPPSHWKPKFAWEIQGLVLSVWTPVTDSLAQSGVCHHYDQGRSYGMPGKQLYPQMAWLTKAPHKQSTIFIVSQDNNTANHVTDWGI